MYSILGVVLAAGKGSRMKSPHLKVLHPLGGKAIVDHVLKTLEALGCHEKVVVINDEMDHLKKYLHDHHPLTGISIQDAPLGTGHALLSAQEFIKKTKGMGVVVFGDTPFVNPETLKKSFAKLEKSPLVVFGMTPRDKRQYGRIALNSEGYVEKIIEDNLCTDEELKLSLCNAGMLAFRTETILPLLEAIPEIEGEYYLFEVVRLAREQGLSVDYVIADEYETQGINSQQELAQAEQFFQNMMRKRFLDHGVTLIDPNSVYFSPDTEIAAGTVIEPHVFFGPLVKITGPAHIKGFCHIEGAEISQGCVVGPFARLRPQTLLAPCVKIGNFVEVKASYISDGSKINHLSYIGDAQVGKDVNIGAGTITCNYDGMKKHLTRIEDNVFIGSNTSLIAPLTIGQGAMIGAGSTINYNVSSHSLALTRADYKEIKEGATRLRFKKKEIL